jgi:hypothetical protein
MNIKQITKQIGRILVLYIVPVLLLSGCVPMATSTEPPGRVTPSPLAIVTTEPETEEGGNTALCPEIEWPAMLLLLTDNQYVLFDPESGETCPLHFAEPIPAMVVRVQNDFFVASRTTGPEGEATVIKRYRADGTVEELPYTMVDTQAGAELVAFIVSMDARLIAWSLLGPTGGSDLPSTSLSIADLDTGEVWGGAAPEIGEAPLALLPIRFSEDGSMLYYALQPYGLGGMWSSYAARYANLYALSTDGAGTPELIFDCAARGLCLGDFFLLNSTVTALAYVNQEAGTIVIQNGEGDLLNSLKGEEDYIGYPMWGPGGEFVYYTADLANDASASPAPAMGLLHRVAPATAPAETVASAPELLLPAGFLNDTQVVVGWAGENDSRGLRLVGIAGSVQLLDVPEGARLLSGAAVSTLLGVSGGSVSIP